MKLSTFYQSPFLDTEQGWWKQFEIGCAKWKGKGWGVKKRLNYHAPLTRYSEFSIISTGLINTGAVEQDGHAQNAHPVFREQNRNSLTSNLQSIKMKICRVVPILDTVGHMTNILG